MLGIPRGAYFVLFSSHVTYARTVEEVMPKDAVHDARNRERPEHANRKVVEHHPNRRAHRRVETVRHFGLADGPLPPDPCERGGVVCATAARGRCNRVGGGWVGCVERKETTSGGKHRQCSRNWELPGLKLIHVRKLGVTWHEIHLRH